MTSTDPINAKGPCLTNPTFRDSVYFLSEPENTPLCGECSLRAIIDDLDRAHAVPHTGRSPRSFLFYHAVLHLASNSSHLEEQGQLPVHSPPWTSLASTTWGLHCFCSALMLALLSFFGEHCRLLYRSCREANHAPPLLSTLVRSP